MVGVQDWIQQCYVFDLVLVRGKGQEKETKKKLKKNSCPVQRNASMRASFLQTDLQSSKDRLYSNGGKTHLP